MPHPGRHHWLTTALFPTEYRPRPGFLCNPTLVTAITNQSKMACKVKLIVSAQNNSWRFFYKELDRIVGMVSITYTSLCFDFFVCLFINRLKMSKEFLLSQLYKTPCSGALKPDPEAGPEDQAPAHLPLQRAPWSPVRELLETLPQWTHRTHWIACKVAGEPWWWESSCSHHTNARQAEIHSLEEATTQGRATVLMRVLTFTSASGEPIHLRELHLPPPNLRCLTFL